MQIAGYAKQKLLNGKTNVFAYLGQYFTNAFVMSNGVPTTNSAGILSEYGEFFPTVPGQVALQTMPDPDQGNTNGTCVVDIIRLSLDVNHDGTMDESYTGPDNTSGYNWANWDGPYSVSYVFWANNDYDRWTWSLLDGSVEDDVQSGSVYSSSPNAPTLSAPDCEYRSTDGTRVIPCTRNLEDFARLWVSGVSNTLTRLPAGSTVTLSWGLVWDGNEYTDPGSPTIDIFQAADADGGTGYLTNLVIASNQINSSLCRYVGRLGPGSNIVLNSSIYENGWAGDHYIFCGVSPGDGILELTVSDGSGNVLAQSPQDMQIVDIKQMYERWTVGDNDKNQTPPSIAPMTNAVLLADGEPNGPTTNNGYLYDPAYDTNDDYILFVHGWNMPAWEKDRFAETAYKRLYWQGYQGRFGDFHWPTTTLNLQHGANYDYDNGEWIAWKSAQGLESLLANLNRNYPGKVYVLAHSMGNVVTGEGLHMAGTNVLVNTYVASQAAVSARAYDNTVPADALAYYYSIGQTVRTPDSEGYYPTNGAPSYFNGIAGASHFVDFYNAVDWALGKWVGDQAHKPEPGYFYSSVADPSGYLWTPSLFRAPSNLDFATDTYQIFSQAVQSYSFALGAETNIAVPFNLSVLPVNLNASPLSFLSTHPGHSEQFRFDNMTTGVYWNQLLQSFKINATPPE